MLVDGVAVGRRSTVDGGHAYDVHDELELLSCRKRTAAGMPSPLQSVSTSLCEHDWFSRLFYWEALHLSICTIKRSALRSSMATSLKWAHPTEDVEGIP